MLSYVKSAYALEKPGQMGISKMFEGVEIACSVGIGQPIGFLKVQLDPPLSNTQW